VIDDYSKEIKFQVGQRVSVDIKEIPVKQRDVTTGTILKIETRFPSTPAMRRHTYFVRFDNKGNYVKKKDRLMGGITEMYFRADRLTLI